MVLPQTYRFVRLPTELLEVLLRTRLSGTQWRILLWVVRYTYGWNREWTPFTWYRIAKDTGLDRAAVYRAGEMLFHANVLVRRDREVAIELNYGAWNGCVRHANDDTLQLWMPGTKGAREQRPPLSANNATVANGPRNGCQEAVFFCQAKDSGKDNLKTHKDSSIGLRGEWRRVFPTAGAATPIPGKYDGLSEN